jgi:predicted phosphoadenosine phosphosulfate sulfurtransferase
VKIDKQILEQDVLDASMERIKWTLENFQKVCVSFSGGKDSSTQSDGTTRSPDEKENQHLFIDWEAQFSHTINT